MLARAWFIAAIALAAGVGPGCHWGSLGNRVRPQPATKAGTKRQLTAFSVEMLAGEPKRLAIQLKGSDWRKRAESAFEIGRRRYHALLPLLQSAVSQDSNFEVRTNAAAALGLLGGPKACRNLHHALEDRDQGVRAAGLLGLLQARCHGAKRASIRVLRAKRVGQLERAAAILVLGEIGGRDAARALVHAVERFPGLRAAARYQLVRLKQIGVRANMAAIRTNPAKVHIDTLMAFCKTAYPQMREQWSHYTKAVPRGVVGIMGQCGGRDAVPFLLEALRHGGSDTRAEVYRVLWETRHPRALPALLRLVDRAAVSAAEAGTACKLALALGAPPRKIAAWLKHRYLEVRQCAQDQVLSHPIRQAKFWLRRQLRGPDRVAARLALAHLNPRKELSLVLAWFKTRRAWRYPMRPVDVLDNPMGRPYVDNPAEPPRHIEALERAARGRVPLLLRLLQGRVRLLRWAAAHTLARLPSPDVRSRMVRWLSSKRRERRRLAALVLHHRARSDLRLVPAITLALFGQSTGPEYQEALAYLRGQPATTRIRATLCATSCLTQYGNQFTLAAHWLEKTRTHCKVEDFARYARSAVSWYHREKAVYCVGERSRLSASVPEVLVGALWDASAVVRAAALGVLRKFRRLQVRFAPPLEFMVRRSRGNERGDALVALGRLLQPPSVVRGPLRRRILRLIRSELRSKNSSRRDYALWAASASEARELRPLITQILRQDPEELCAISAANWFDELGLTPRARAMKALYRRAKTFRPKALAVLARLGHKASLAELRTYLSAKIRTLSDSDQAEIYSTLVRLGVLEAIRALDAADINLKASTGTRRHLPMLLAALHPGAAFPSRLIRALVRLKDVRAVPWLIRFLKLPPGNDTDARPSAALALGKLGDPRARAALRATARSKDEELREASMEALRQLGVGRTRSRNPKYRRRGLP